MQKSGIPRYRDIHVPFTIFFQDTFSK